MVERRMNRAPQREQTNAGEEAEQMAREQREAELQEREPQDARELIVATIETVNQLMRDVEEHLPDNDEALEILTHIDERLQTYLVHEESEVTPTPYVEAFFNDEAELVERFNAHLLAELNPLLHRLHRALMRHDARTKEQQQLQNREALAARLNAATVDSQMVHTLFARLEGWSFDRPDMPVRLIVEDPLAKDKQNYWVPRAKEQQVYGIEKPEKVIASRSFTAAYELESAAEIAEERGDEKSAQACRLLAGYITQQGELMERNFTRTVRDLDFVHGDPDQLFNVLNAAEIVKQQEPALYASLLGVSPKPGATAEAQMSPLTGNAFHIAVARSQHYELGDNIGDNVSSDLLPAIVLLKERVRLMTEMRTSQLPLMHVGRLQIAGESLALRGVAQEAIDRGNNEALYMIAGLLGRRGMEIELARLLKSVDVAEREKHVEDLRTATPREFLALVRGLSEDALEDPRIHEVVAERLRLTNEEEEMNKRPNKAHIITRLSRHDYNNDGSNSGKNVTRGIALDVLDQLFGEDSPEQTALQMMLWETMPKEAVLSEEFFDDIIQAQKRAQKKETTTMAGRPWLGESVLYAAAHPDITEEEWSEWYGERRDMHVKRGIVAYARGQHPYPSDVLKKVFMNAPPTLIERVGPSRFTYLQFLFKMASTTSKVESMSSTDSFKFLGTERGYGYDLKPYHGASLDAEGLLLPSEKEAMEDPVRLALIEFRTSPAKVFIERFSSILAGPRGGVFTHKHLHAFVEKLGDREKKVFLDAYFDQMDHTAEATRITGGSFAPHNPWQRSVLELGQQYIPEHQGYQLAVEQMSSRRAESTEVPHDPGSFPWYTGEETPRWGMPRVDTTTKHGQIQFRTAQGNMREYPFSYSKPRFVEDENSRFYPEAWNADTAQWERIPMYDRFEVLEKEGFFNPPRLAGLHQGGPVVASFERGSWRVQRRDAKLKVVGESFRITEDPKEILDTCEVFGDWLIVKAKKTGGFHSERSVVLSLVTGLPLPKADADRTIAEAADFLKNDEKEFTTTDGHRVIHEEGQLDIIDVTSGETDMSIRLQDHEIVVKIREGANGQLFAATKKTMRTDTESAGRVLLIGEK